MSEKESFLLTKYGIYYVNYIEVKPYVDYVLIEFGYKDEEIKISYQKYVIHPSKLMEFIRLLEEAKNVYMEKPEAVKVASIEVPKKIEEIAVKKPTRRTSRKREIEAKICPNCGYENKPIAKFCARCGTKLI